MQKTYTFKKRPVGGRAGIPSKSTHLVSWTLR